MAIAQLFQARKNSVVAESENGEIIIVRDGLIPAQAKAMAACLNSTASDTEFKATRREQKFSVDITYHAEIIPHGAYDYSWSVAEVKRDVENELENFECADGDIEKEKFKIIVKKVYDKQVPNV